MTDSNQQDTTYVSIQADVRIDWRLLSEQQALQAINGFTTRSSAIGLRSEIEYNKEALAPSIRKIRKQHPEIASWLNFLQQTVETLATQLSEQRNASVDTPASRVSISASGIEFQSAQPCEVGDTIEMVLGLESIASIMVIGEIVDVCINTEPHTEDKPHLLTIRFRHIRESDQEILIRHIHRLQLEELRAARASRYE